MATEHLDVVAITESWIHSDTRDYVGEYEIPSYKMFHKDRTLREGGGILMYVKDSLNPVDCKIRSDHEVLGVDLHLANAAYRLVLVYRPPHQLAEKDEDLYTLLSDIIRGKTCTILGDFNCHVNWENRTADAEGMRLVDFANDNFLSQWVNEPTRGNNILDLVFTTEDDGVTRLSVGESLGGSDHNLIRLSLRAACEKASGTQKRKLDFRRADFTGFRESLDGIRLEGNDVNAMYCSLKEQFMERQGTFIPLKSVKSNSLQPKWFNNDIASAVKERKALYKRAKRSQDQNDWDSFKTVCRRVKSLIKVAKRNEEIRVASRCKQSPKEFFSHVNSRKPFKGSIGPLKDPLGRIQVSDLDMTNTLNDYFASVFTLEDTHNMASPTLTHERVEMDTISCTLEEVKERIDKLNIYKSSGPDGFLPRVLKEVRDQVAPLLMEIFNKSLETGEVPEEWKVADITPIFKKGDRECPANFRPISLTSIIGKMLEGIIVDRIVEHLESQNLILDSQHGFRRHRSCLTNLLEFFHKMLCEYDKDKAVDILYLDFQKAFDKVPHLRLLSKVSALGVNREVTLWIENWLANRKQRVVINGTSSDWASVTSGVPQGSVLGPLLFIIYVNDIDIGLLSVISKFADDIKLGANVSSPEGIEKLQTDLRRLGEWSETWQMPFNLDKCKVMHIGSANPRSDYSLLGQTLEVTDLEKDLGVLISSDLKFSKQCIEVEKKAQKLLGYIQRQFQYRNKEIVLTLYNSLIRPLLEYAVQFWSPTLRKDIERLERVQARATKLIPSIRRLSYQDRLKALGLFSLETRRLRGQLIEVFKILNGFDNVDHRNLFSLNTNSTRNHGWKLELNRFNTSICENFFTYKICSTWNKLPTSVVNSTTVEQFKRNLDRILHTL